MTSSAPTARRFSLFAGLYRSFYCRALYEDVGACWKGLGFAYLLLALAILWLVLMAGLVVASRQAGLENFSSEIYAEIKEELGATGDTWPQQAINDGMRVLSALPPMAWKENRLHVNAPQPYVIAKKDSAEPLILFDTSGEHQSLEHSEAYALVTATRLVIKNPYSERAEHERVFYLSELAQDDPATFDQLLYFLSNVPAAELHDGILTVPGETPYFLPLPLTREHIEGPLLLAFGGELPQALQDNVIVWFGAQDAAYQTERGETGRFSYRDLTDEHAYALFTRTVEALSTFLLIALLITTPFVIVFLAAFYFIWAVVLSIPASLLNLFIKARLHMEDVIRLTCVAMTPALTFYVINALTGLLEHYNLLAMSAVTLLYVAFALLVNKTAGASSS